MGYALCKPFHLECTRCIVDQNNKKTTTRNVRAVGCLSNSYIPLQAKVIDEPKPELATIIAKND